MAKTKGPRRMKSKRSPKDCLFCKENKNPSFEDSAALQKFLSERGKIVPRMRSGLCAKHQKNLAKQVKYARHLAILPFVSR